MTVSSPVEITWGDQLLLVRCHPHSNSPRQRLCRNVLFAFRARKFPDLFKEG